MTKPNHNITRGGQTYLHSVRMLLQIIRLWGLLIILSWGIVFYASLWLRPNELGLPSFTKAQEVSQRQWFNTIKYWGRAKLALYLHSQEFKPRPSYSRLMDYQYFVHSDVARLVEKHVWRALCIATWFSVFFSVLIGIWLKWRGIKLGKAKLLSGFFLAKPKILKRAIKNSGKTSKFKLANIPLPKNSEQQHFLIHGSTGTGKSVAINSLLEQIRKMGDKAIIYDKHGTFTQYFYKPEVDYLLNPLDARSAPWNLWLECKTDSQFDNLAAALIPQHSNASDPFWVLAARMLFATTARKLHTAEQQNITNLLELLFASSSDDLRSLVRGTEAESLLADDSSKVLLSIKSVLATYVRPLRLLQQSLTSGDNLATAAQQFSIHDWLHDQQAQPIALPIAQKTGKSNIATSKPSASNGASTSSKTNNKRQSSWLFISSNSQQHETLKPLISSWLDVAVSSLMANLEDEDNAYDIKGKHMNRHINHKPKPGESHLNFKQLSL